MNLPTGKYAITGQQEIELSAYLGKWLVLYFYPKDATPGCTREGQEFRDAYADFAALQAEIIGISRDSIACHERFKQKEQFPFPLLSDHEEALCKHFDVIKEKNLYGKKSLGIERSTFLIDPNGIIQHEWRKVKVEGHVATVYQTLLKLVKG